MEINNCMLKYAKHTHVTRGTYTRTNNPLQTHRMPLQTERGAAMSPAIPAPPGEGEREQDEDPSED